MFFIGNLGSLFIVIGIFASPSELVSLDPITSPIELITITRALLIGGPYSSRPIITLAVNIADTVLSFDSPITDRWKKNK
jgi:hypothetical protein